MRAARADDYWRRTYQRQFPLRCEQVSYADLQGLGSGLIRFEGGITAIVGANGVGKSTLIAAVCELLGGNIALEELDHVKRVQGSANVARVITPQGAVEPRVIIENNVRQYPVVMPEDCNFVWLDPAYRAAQTRKLIARDAHFNEVLEGIEPRKLNAAELEALNYAVGKTFSDCLVYEIPEYADIETFPYFKATAGGVQYGSEAMGQGELSLLFVFWAALSIPQNSILVVEEPETHVSPRSQQAIMNVIAQAAAEKGAWVVVTTHSPTVISRIPLRHVRLLTRDGANVHIVDNPRQFQLAQILTGGQNFQGVMLVEDEAAYEFVISILDQLDPDLLRQYEIAIAGTNDKITSTLRTMPKTRRWFTMIGAYDGDQRNAAPDAHALTWPFTFLPGHVAPDRLLRDAAQALGAAAIAQELGSTPGEVMPTLDAAQGLDAHDWLHSFANGLGLSLGAAVRSLVRLWLAQGHVPDCQEFLQALRSAPEAARG